MRLKGTCIRFNGRGGLIDIRIERHRVNKSITALEKTGSELIDHTRKNMLKGTFPLSTIKDIRPLIPFIHLLWGKKNSLSTQSQKATEYRISSLFKVNNSTFLHLLNYFFIF